MASTSIGGGFESPVASPVGGAGFGAPIVLTASTPGTAQLIYTPVASAGAWDSVTIIGGSLDGTARRIYLLWGAQDIAYLLPPQLCAADAGSLMLIKDQFCRQDPTGVAVFGLYAYTDVASSGLVAVKAQGVLVRL